MARMTSGQAEAEIKTVLLPLLKLLTPKIGYDALIYWPGDDAPYDPKTTKVYAIVLWQAGVSERWIGVDGGSIKAGTLTINLNSTERKSDKEACRSVADEIEKTLSPLRCGDLWFETCTWTETAIQDGRVMIMLSANYKFESY